MIKLQYFFPEILVNFCIKICSVSQFDILKNYINKDYHNFATIIIIEFKFIFFFQSYVICENYNTSKSERGKISGCSETGPWLAVQGHEAPP